jgi:hypothetical protein
MYSPKHIIMLNCNDICMNSSRYDGNHVKLQWNMHKQQQQEDMVAKGRHCDWFK